MFPVSHFLYRHTTVHQVETYYRITKLHNNTGSKRKTHYDILGVSKSCTRKEIRDAFIKLSKELHPDHNNNDPKNHAEFVKLNEAYNVLIRPDKRRMYDESLTAVRRYSRGPSFYEQYNEFGEPRTWRDETIWHMRNRAEDKYHEGKPYYGIRGIKKLPNSRIVIGCLVLMAIGTLFQFVAITRSVTFSRKKLDQQSEENERILAEVREEALKYTREGQIENMRKKLGMIYAKDVDDTEKPPDK